MTFDAFISGTYEAPAAAWDAQRAINLYVEADESGAGKSPKALIGTPGLAVFDTLPTQPVRGIWTGLVSPLPGSSATDLCYVASGPYLYQVFANGTHSIIGNSIGDDAAHSPVTFQVNGGQILITSAGLAYVYDGVTLQRAYFNNGLGYVNVAGTAVTWVSGDAFDSTLVGQGIVLNGFTCIIAAVPDSMHLTLATSGGSLTNAPYRILAGGGTVRTQTVFTNDVYWESGNNFAGVVPGSGIIINGAVYIVTAVISPVYLRVFSSPGTQFGVSFSADTTVPASMSAFLDAYGIVLPPDSKNVNISGLNAAGNSDFTLWNPLDYGRKAAFPDNIGSILTDHEELWLFGSETTEVWRNTGNADFPLERDPGAFIAQGIRAPFSAVSLANGVAWIGGDARGNPVAWRAQGYQPVRVSTHGIETAWAAYTTITDATAFVYVVRGHQFWVITFPSANATWVYDATAGLWHERGWWNGATIDRARYATHGYVFGMHLVGDWQTGQLYQLDESIYTDAGTTIRRIRTAPHLTNEELYTYYDRFRLSMQGSGLNPMLDWSDDGGATWHAARAASGRSIGGLTQQSVWRRLGKARDRVWRITITDAAQVAIFAAYLDIGAGTV